MRVIFVKETNRNIVARYVDSVHEERTQNGVVAKIPEQVFNGTPLDVYAVVFELGRQYEQRENEKRRFEAIGEIP